MRLRFPKPVSAVALAAALLAACAAPAAAMTEQERRAYLEKLQQILPDAPAFRAWLEKSGELPPDFDSLPRRNTLPDPLRFVNGQPVRTAADWKRRRDEIFKLFEKYQTGVFPPKPHLERVVPIDETHGD